jgi:DNA-binding SARP family transcriptional activator/predicted ATPase
MGLKIYLLGQFKLLANDRRVELPSRPAQSLLAYLALNAGVTLRREKLASLLWPEATETNARSYLRQALWRIRKALESASLSGEDFLQIRDISVAFNEQSDYWLDAAILLQAAEDKSLKELTKTAGLYRGELLPGFYEEWVVLERDRLESAYHQKMNLLMERLIQAEEWDNAIEWSEQWIKLGHAPEPAFRALMHAHANTGDLSMVTTTYQRCVESLNRELNLEPSPETQQLYERILNRELEQVHLPPTRVQTPATRRPAFLDETAIQPLERPIFVAREHELAQLEEQLDKVLNGQGRVVFITGEAGSGKTALLQEFTRRAQEAHIGLIVASGNCNAHTGIGDPYLPFREILELLTGDVEARWTAGAISRKHAQVLWNLLPTTAQALVECGPDLINTFIPGSLLFERAAASTPGGAGWLSSLEEMSDRQMTDKMIPGPQQSDIFEQYTRVLGTLARQAALVLVVDDLQWADSGSVGLLFHLGRHLTGSCILILGAYRPEEIALGRDGDRHPLDPVISEFQRQFGEITVDLSQAERREFIESLLDSELNRLGPSFRQMLYQQTHGHPLFTIELLRGMQERGDVVKDKDDHWIEAAALDWVTLPARVEAVIGERIKRLAQPLRAALRVASVEGEEFSAEVVSRVLGSDEREVVRQLSSELDRKHRLIRARAIERLGPQRLSRYRFRHYLCQMYLYENLDPVERSFLHEDVGNVLEELYEDQTQETAAIAPQLAHHFQEAGITNKAIHYLHQAGERAVQLSAYQEGIAHLQRGLGLLTTLPESSSKDHSLRRNQQELAMQIALGMAWRGPKGYGPEVKKAYTRARELCQQLGKTTQLCRVLGELSVFHYVQAEYQQARELGEQALDLAQQAKNPMLLVISHWCLGFIWFSLGAYMTARTHLEQVIAFYNHEQHHHSLVFMRGSDAGLSALAYDALCLWCLGYPDQALSRSQETLTLARELDHPYTLADILCYAGCMFDAMRRDASALMEHAEELIRLSSEKGLGGWKEIGYCFQGEALALLGQISEGIAQIRKSIAAYESIGIRLYLPGWLRALAEVQAKANHPEEGFTNLVEALALVDETDERHWEAELYRLMGSLLLLLGNEPEVESNLQKAIAVARKQKAKSWELRATTDLASLWASQGKTDEAHMLLAPVYDWFTEGFDTPDLIAARRLLKELT